MRHVSGRRACSLTRQSPAPALPARAANLEENHGRKTFPTRRGSAVAKFLVSGAADPRVPAASTSVPRAGDSRDGRALPMLKRLRGPAVPPDVRRQTAPETPFRKEDCRPFSPASPNWAHGRRDQVAHTIEHIYSNPASSLPRPARVADHYRQDTAGMPGLHHGACTRSGRSRWARLTVKADRAKPQG